MSLLATTILPALLPALGDAIRGGVARLTGGTGAQPQNVDEYIRVQEADIKRLQALAELDRPAGNISLWVANLRASARYLATFAVILNAIVLSFVPGVVSDQESGRRASRVQVGHRESVSRGQPSDGLVFS